MSGLFENLRFQFQIHRFILQVGWGWGGLGLERGGVVGRVGRERGGVGCREGRGKVEGRLVVDGGRLRRGGKGCSR